LASSALVGRSPVFRQPGTVPQYSRTAWETAYIEPGSPWENGYVESFNGKLHAELLKGEIFYTLAEAKIVIDRAMAETLQHQATTFGTRL